MDVVGYTDRLSVAPGETIRFMVSCKRSTYRADLVRLIHGDENPQGPGFKERQVPSAIAGDYPGRQQEIATGSHIFVPDHPQLRLVGGFTLQAWICPTMPAAGMQGILAKQAAPAGHGYALVVDDEGVLALWIGDSGGRQERFGTGHPLRAGEWTFVAAVYDAERGAVALYQEPDRVWPDDPARVIVERPATVRAPGSVDAPFLIAGLWQPVDNGPPSVIGHFNGKIDRPRLFGRTLTSAEIAALRHGTDPQQLGEAVLATWDFAADVSSARVTDASGHGHHGRAVNMPTRGVTGHNWTGEETDFRQAPDQYGAIHFHDDDLEDAGWEADFALTIPADLPSGVYAARLRTATAEDHLPFVVRPPRGTATAPIALLLSTNTYLAYANFSARELSHIVQADTLFPNQNPALHKSEHRYMTDNHLLSLYDTHRDGSGVCYSSRLRPILNLRPKFRFWLIDCPHAFPADLYLVDWLEAKGYRADAITDEDLHAEGLELLRPYRVVVTSTHPEYWTRPMLAALERYLADGGRLMYLGGNGFYWVTSVDPERPHVIEIRRWGGTESWRAAPGEYHHSTTGELGGLWRNRGQAPQRLVGVGFTAQGFDRAARYRRQPDSFDSRAAFIFEGIGADELIGDGPNLILEYGAAGFEMDRFDPTLGSPPHTLVLATAADYSDSYQFVVEEVLMSDSTQGGSRNPLVRSDMVYVAYPDGGAVFSVGSIAWCGALSNNGYDNNVSQITDNVLRRFAADEPLPRAVAAESSASEGGR